MKRFPTRNLYQSYRVTPKRFFVESSNGETTSNITKNLFIPPSFIDAANNNLPQQTSTENISINISSETVPRIPGDLLTRTEIFKVDCYKQLDLAIEDIKQCKEVGFDTEWFSWNKELPTPHLIQIATKERAYLFPFNFDHSGLEPTSFRYKIYREIKLILENQEIKKIGFDLVQDHDNLLKDRQIKIHNMFDIKRKYAFRYGVAKLYNVLYEKTFNKSKKIQISNWTRFNSFTNNQIIYAGNDAYICLMIYEKLQTQPHLVKEINAMVLSFMTITNEAKLHATNAHNTIKNHSLNKPIDLKILEKELLRENKIDETSSNHPNNKQKSQPKAYPKVQKQSTNNTTSKPIINNLDKIK